MWHHFQKLTLTLFKRRKLASVCYDTTHSLPNDKMAAASTTTNAFHTQFHFTQAPLIKTSNPSTPINTPTCNSEQPTSVSSGKIAKIRRRGRLHHLRDAGTTERRSRFRFREIASTPRKKIARNPGSRAYRVSLHLKFGDYDTAVVLFLGRLGDRPSAVFCFW